MSIIDKSLIPSWFDLNKYEKLNELSSYVFAYNLLVRRIILFVLSKNQKDLHEEIVYLIDQIKKYGVLEEVGDFVMDEFMRYDGKASLFGVSDSVGLGVVTRLPILKACEIYEAVKRDTKFRHYLALCKDSQYKHSLTDPVENQSSYGADTYPWEFWYENVFLKASIKELDTSLGEDDTFDNIVCVDLNAPDDLLIDGFRDWLRDTRSSTEIFPDPDFQIGKTDLKDVEQVRSRIIRASVIPYLDLKIHSKIEDAKITYNLIGRAIFSNSIDIDTTEAVRKTTRPLAKQVISMAIKFMRVEEIKQTEDDYGIK